jgi:hypothetical protein
VARPAAATVRLQCPPLLPLLQPTLAGCLSMPGLGFCMHTAFTQVMGRGPDLIHSCPSCRDRVACAARNPGCQVRICSRLHAGLARSSRPSPLQYLVPDARQCHGWRLTAPACPMLVLHGHIPAGSFDRAHKQELSTLRENRFYHDCSSPAPVTVVFLAWFPPLPIR